MVLTQQEGLTTFVEDLTLSLQRGGIRTFQEAEALIKALKALQKGKQIEEEERVLTAEEAVNLLGNFLKTGLTRGAVHNFEEAAKIQEAFEAFKPKE